MRPICRRNGLALGTLALAFALGGSAGRAHGLATESVGNAPIGRGLNFSTELLTAVNVPCRVYWYEVNGNPTFYFRGTARERNDAVRHFAKIPAEKREIILVPGPAETTTLGRDRRIAYDWSLHVPMGLHFAADPDVGDTRATLTVHIPAPRPAPPAQPQQVERWIAELGSDDFKVRESAKRALEELGAAAGPALRAARQAAATAEGRDRIDRLLGRLPGLEVDALELPADIAVIGLDDLVERYRKGLKHKDGHVRGYAVGSLVHRYGDAEQLVPELIQFLQKEKDEYALRCAASALARLGTGAKPALPAMRDHAASEDKNVRHSFEHAIELIEKDNTAAPTNEDLQNRRAVRRDIAAFLKARSEANKDR